MKKTSRLGFGNRLRELREMLDVTQAELADAASIDQSLLSKYEREDVSPSWLQIERLLEALGQSPCSLFPEECAAHGRAEDEYFSMDYFSGKPKDSSGRDTPTATLRIHNDSPFVRLFHLPPISGRYIVSKAEDDVMIPDWYPGDHIVIDTKPGPTAGKVVVGFLDEEPLARRLVRDGKNMLLVASNRNYPPIPWSKARWVHVGVVVYGVRDLTKRYTGVDGTGEG